MSEFYNFFGEHPFLGCVLLWTAYCFVALPVRLVNRYFRSRNIKAAGWPPTHLDADGDHISVNDNA